MKRKSLAVICTVLTILMTCMMFFAGCNNTPVDTTSKEYTIQYTDDSGIHSIEVQSGKLYSISAIPEKNGYEFMGLYDAEVGGTQYVNAGGSAVAAFTDNKNIVLYPQFRAKEYTLILDYQGAAVTGSRSLKVAYDSEISELPLNLTLENKNFVGWYTEPNRKGNQIADQYGVLPENRKVTEKLFDLSDPDGNIKLYAGFKGEEFTVTFYFTESGAPEEVKVEYGTPISEVQLETRINGQAVITWSKKRNDTNKEQAFTGKVTSEMVLYAAEFAPVIDFDSNGGNYINSIIARAGDAINLPTPVRENYKFVGWQTASGSTFNASTMPTASTKLMAKWQAMIIFDTNGGTEVNNISEPQGTRVTLPSTDKDGYVFAGWFTENKEQYTSTTMPAVSIKIKAGWYKTQQVKLVIKSADEGTASTGGIGSSTVGPKADWRKVLDLSEYLSESGGTIKITFHYEMSLGDNTDKGFGGFYLYDSPEVSDAYCLHKYTAPIYDSTWEKYEYTATINMRGTKLYVCYVAGLTEWHYNIGSYYGYVYFRNIWAEMEYSDTSTLN